MDIGVLCAKMYIVYCIYNLDHVSKYNFFCFTSQVYSMKCVCAQTALFLSFFVFSTFLSFPTLIEPLIWCTRKGNITESLELSERVGSPSISQCFGRNGQTLCSRTGVHPERLSSPTACSTCFTSNKSNNVETLCDSKSALVGTCRWSIGDK